MRTPYFLFLHPAAAPLGGILDFHGAYERLQDAVNAGRTQATHSESFHVIDVRSPIEILHQEEMTSRDMAALAQGIDLRANPEADVPAMEKATARTLYANRPGRRPRRKRPIRSSQPS